jgi:hypothetical protein
LLSIALLLVPVLVTVATPVRSVAAEGDRVVNIAMQDQFKNRHETLRMQGDVVVLVYAERKGAEAALEVGRKLHVRFHPTASQAPATEWSRQPVAGLPGWPAGLAPPDVHVIPVACLPEVPKALETVARSRLRKESQFVSVWLDFEDIMRQRFGMVPDEPNIVLIDTRGCPQGVLSGRVDDAKLAEVAGLIDRLRLQSLADRTASAPSGTTIR